MLAHSLNVSVQFKITINAKSRFHFCGVVLKHYQLNHGYEINSEVSMKVNVSILFLSLLLTACEKPEVNPNRQAELLVNDDVLAKISN